MNLLLITTFPSSLKLWNELGILEREISPYKKLAYNKNIKIRIITFGNEDDTKFVDSLGNIELIPAFKHFGKLEKIFGKMLLSIFIPFRFKNIFLKSDIIKHNQFWGSWVGYIAKFFYRKKLIIRNGYNYFRFQKQKGRSKLFIAILKTISKIILYYADQIIVTTREMKSHFIEDFKLNEEMIHVVPNFIDMTLFKKEKVNKKKEILIVGRLTKQKNLEQLFKLISNCEYKINIIGDGNISYYKNLAEKYNLKTKFIKNIENKNLKNYFNSSSIYIIYSLYEGNPKSLLEAMSCEMNIIASNVEGIKDIITNNVNGILVDLGDPIINNHIHELMTNDKKSNELGNNARSSVKKSNAIQNIVKKFQLIYESHINLNAK